MYRYWKLKFIDEKSESSIRKDILDKRKTSQEELAFMLYNLVENKDAVKKIIIEQ